MFTDLTQFLYLLIGLISSLGSILFIYWLIRYKWYRSSVFCYVILLLVGESIRSWICIYGRNLLLTRPGEFSEFSMGFWWSGRLIFTLVSIFAIVIHMGYRAATKSPKNIVLKRRSTDEP